MKPDHIYQTYRPDAASSNRQQPRILPVERSSPQKIFLAALAILVIVAFSIKIISTVIDHFSVKPAQAAAPTFQPDTTKMATQINAVIAAYPDIDISVAVTNINTGQSNYYGDTAGYIGASTAKLITASLYLHEVQAGDYTLQSTINGHTANYELRQLIENSDNDAWQAFNDELGHPALQAWATQMGMTSYNADTNILTTKDMAILLQKLYKGQLLNAANTKLLLSYMALANRTDLIASAVPAGDKIYHKAGWLDDRIHDAAIIDNGTTPYVLVIFSKTDGHYDLTMGQKIFHDITAGTLQAFSPQVAK